MIQVHMSIGRQGVLRSCVVCDKKSDWCLSTHEAWGCQMKSPSPKLSYLTSGSLNSNKCAKYTKYDI